MGLKYVSNNLFLSFPIKEAICANSASHSLSSPHSQQQRRPHKWVSEKQALRHGFAGVCGEWRPLSCGGTRAGQRELEGVSRKAQPALSLGSSEARKQGDLRWMPHLEESSAWAALGGGRGAGELAFLSCGALGEGPLFLISRSWEVGVCGCRADLQVDQMPHYRQQNLERTELVCNRPLALTPERPSWLLIIGRTWKWQIRSF